MSANRSGQVQTSRFYKYLNDIIIRPTQVLIEEESNFLSLENDELKKNNEELSNRIDQMFQEFDLISGSNKRIYEGYGHLVGNSKKSKKDSDKFRKTFHSKNSQTSTQITNAKLQSYDTENDGALHEIQKKENEARLDNRTKVLPIKKTENRDSVNFPLEIKLKSVQNQSEMLQRDSETVSKSLKGCRKENSMAPEQVKKQSDRSSSPIYLDIFDNSDQALKFKSEHEKCKIQRNSKNTNSLVAKIYSEIPVLGTLVELPNETGLDTQSKFINPRANYPEHLQYLHPEEDFNKQIADMNDNIVRNSTLMSLSNKSDNLTSIDTIGLSVHNLLDLSETQKAIMNLISQNSEIIQDLHKEQSMLSKSRSTESLESQIYRGTKNSKTCQNYPANENSSMCVNQSVHCVNESAQILRKIDEQNIKIENLSETLSMILNKTDDIKTPSTNRCYNNESNSKLEQNSLLNKELHHHKDSDIAKYTQSLEFSVNNHNDNDTINDNYNTASLAYSFSDPSDPPIHLFTDRFSSENLFSEKSNNENENFQLIANINTANKRHSNAKKQTENRENINSFLTNEETIVKTETLSLSQNQPMPKSCKIPKRINYNNGKLQSKSHDKFEILFSNDLESSYETLYDPILSARSLVNDENIAYL